MSHKYEYKTQQTTEMNTDGPHLAITTFNNNSTLNNNNNSFNQNNNLFSLTEDFPMSSSNQQQTSPTSLDPAALAVIQTTVENAVENVMKNFHNTIQTAVENAVENAIKNAVQNAVSTSMGRIVEEIRSLRRDVTELSKLPNKELKKNSIMPVEPFQTLEQFLEFEALLQVAENYNQFKTDLKHGNKYTGAKYVRTVWRALLTDKCAEHFSWSGTLEKKSVRLLKTSLAIRDVFIHEVNGNEGEYVSGTKTVFQFARNRQKQRGNQNVPPSNSFN